jgi:hypothetical protein
MSYGSMLWVKRDYAQPLPGSRVVAFTPIDTDLRYRVCDAEFLRTMTDATHWAYLSPPADYFE